VKSIPKITYLVSSGTLNLNSINQFERLDKFCCVGDLLEVDMIQQ